MILRDDPLGLLRPAVGRCLGAAFVTHVFDERFMEQVLAALLPIEADPEADARFFIDEGRRRLRQTPVVVVADARQYVGGHRLPFDVVLSPWNTRVHARLALLLFEDHARLLMGSGNLTRGGFGKNAELFTSSTLDYARDAAVFRRVTELVVACGAEGDAWSRFQAQLDVMVTDEGRGDVDLLAGDDVVDQFFARIPRSARIERVAIAAAASAEDDPGDVAPLFQALGAFLKKRKAKSAPVDVVLPWSSSGGARWLSEASDLDEAAGKLAVLREKDALLWCEVEAVTAERVTLATGGRRLQFPRAALLAQEESTARFWLYGEATGSGPVEELEAFASSYDVTWWIWPESLPGARRRPLHGCWLLVQTKEGKTRRSHVLTGAFQPAAPKGQRVITAGLHWQPKKALSSEELGPDAVRAPEQFFLQEAGLPPPRQLPPPPATACVYDAARRTLRITWRPAMRGVKATYSHPGGDVLLVEGAPGIETLVKDFDLDRLSAEVCITQGEHVWLLPMSVINLMHLPADEGARPDTLRAWVTHHLGGRRAVVEDGLDDPGASAPVALTTAPRDVFAAFDALKLALEQAGAFAR
jgi:hypothetical protein